MDNTIHFIQPKNDDFEQGSRHNIFSEKRHTKVENVSHLQKQGNVTDKKLDTEVENKGGRRHFFPGVGGHLGNLGVNVHEEELIV